MQPSWGPSKALGPNSCIKALWADTKADFMMRVLDLVKYLMFVFNVLGFGGGICLLTVGIWAAADPNGFQSIVSSPLLTIGAYLIIFVGVALAILGFLGCFGAIKENRSTLLLFFVLVFLVFSVEIVAAALILVNRKQTSLMGRIKQNKYGCSSSYANIAALTQNLFSEGLSLNSIKAEFFLSDLQRNYQGDNASDVFSTSWNTIMIAFSCCGISGPDDFGNCSHFQEQQPDELWPRACCTRERPLHVAHLLDWNLCRQRDPKYLNSQSGFPMKWEESAKSLQHDSVMEQQDVATSGLDQLKKALHQIRGHMEAITGVQSVVNELSGQPTQTSEPSGLPLAQTMLAIPIVIVPSVSNQGHSVPTPFCQPLQGSPDEEECELDSHQ
uniref:Uncharacterized protein n=1 Tax=Sphaerodactylus townsendi TaxID=933632 RepID=A0ACB8F558_9SAUR